ncbi:MAG: nodulation protein [Symploca sp. SIO2C1]|nr:nodulation protein [Symploca sp. SIO2C1]
MLVLGLTGGLDLISENIFKIPFGSQHDASATLIENGKIIAAVEEERLNRNKHTNKAPMKAAEECLSISNYLLSDLDWIAIPLLEKSLDHSLAHMAIEQPDFGCYTSRTFLQKLLMRKFNIAVNPDKFYFVNHHEAHAASAYYPSSFEHALVLAIDGEGQGYCGAVYSATHQEMKQLRTYSRQRSLGNFYTDVTFHLGFKEFDEYKVMGLASYGDSSRYRSKFKELYSLQSEGNYDFDFSELEERLYQIIPRRLKADELTQQHCDLAAALQATLEEIVLHVLTYFQGETNHKNLCLAGGVALNCTMNKLILSKGIFENVFVQPASHDGGLSMGAAFLAHTHSSATRIEPLSHVYLGTHIGDDQSIVKQIEKWSDFCEYEQFVNIEEVTAQCLAQGSIVGWCQGRAEFGPRALGNRSILADPRYGSNKDRINSIVKMRELFRPFAPAVLEKYAHEIYQIPAHLKNFPFMTFTFDVKDEYVSKLEAVTHVDDTARIQTVSKEINPRFWNLINSFHKLTGIPIVLNTSFNNNCEPIVNSVDEAITCFLTSDLDVLVIGNTLIRKINPSIIHNKLLQLMPKLSEGWLLCGTSLLDNEQYLLRNTFNDNVSITLSRGIFELLLHANSFATFTELISRLVKYKGTDFINEPFLNEIYSLWSRRVITLRPTSN